jgi:FkbM family methyltransferase
MGISHEKIKELIGIKENITIFEIGCADGRDSKTFLNTFDNNMTLYTFDPEPLNAKLVTTLGYYDAFGGSNDALVTDERHKFNHCAMCDYTGTIIFNRSRNNDGPSNGHNWGRYSGSIHKPVTHIESPKYGKRWSACVFEETIEVECTTIDDFCFKNNIKHIDFIWMDTQGSEREVFLGSKNMLPNIDFIYTEYYDEEMYENCAGLSEIKELLDGFEIMMDWRYNDADGGDVLFRRVYL